MAEGEIKVTLTAGVNAESFKQKGAEAAAAANAGARQMRRGTGLATEPPLDITDPTQRGRQAMQRHFAWLAQRTKEQANLQRALVKPAMERWAGVGAGPDRGAGYAAWWKQQTQAMPTAAVAGAMAGSRGLGTRGFQSMLYGLNLGFIGRFAALSAPFALLGAGLVLFTRNLRKANEEFTRMLTRARDLNVSVFRSGGLPVGFVSQRKALSQITGLAENEVMQLGSAIGDLAQKSALAADSLARTAPQFTTVDRLRKLTELNNQAAEAERKRSIIGLDYWLAKSDEWASRVITLPIARARNDIAKLFGFHGAPEAPRIPFGAERLQMSNWERMGMVVGTGGNPASETARNTAETVKRLDTLLLKIAGDRTNYTLATHAQP